MTPDAKLRKSRADRGSVPCSTGGGIVLKPLSESGSISARFEEVATIYPDKTAVRGPDGPITYRRLNLRANRIANALCRVTGETPLRIASLFDQGTDALASHLAILKTGHAFVPLDSADPEARLQSIVEDCMPAAIVTDRKHAGMAARLGRKALPVVVVTDLDAGVSETNPGLAVPADALACLFYTSGSTGQPKGVRQNHRNLLHYVSCYGKTLGIGEHDRLSLLYSLSFSASNMDVFGGLLNGATVCMYDTRSLGASGIAPWIEKENITVFHTVPTVFRHVLKNKERRRKFSSVRVVDLGGETVYSADVELHRRSFPPECPLINHLAATEISVIAQCRIDHRFSWNGDTLPVGIPAPETRIRIVQENGEESPVGEVGELVVHSPFLSPGYWRRPELNVRAFRPDPGRRGWGMYFSGDFGFLDSEGRLHFLGRKDCRVKIRGHSVDPGEVESSLRLVPWIRNAAVIARREGEEADIRLVAFLESAGGEPDHPHSRLRRFLQKRISGYMIPSRFVFVRKLPVTSTGKIDRRALAGIEWKQSGFEGDAGLQDESDELTRTVARHFRKVLNRPGIGNIDFFLLGDSLKAATLHLRLEEALGIRIPMTRLFENPTIEGMVACIAELLRSPEKREQDCPDVLLPVRTTGTRPILFLVHGKKGLAFVSPRFLNLLGEDQPVYSFRASGLNRNRMKSNSVEEMAAEYVRAVRSVQPNGPYFIGSICIGSTVAVEMARHLAANGEKVGPLLLIDPPLWYPAYRPLWKKSLRIVRERMKKLKYPLVADTSFARSLKKRKAQGRIGVDVEDMRSVRKAATASYDFTLALFRYRLRSYRGPVFLLQNSGRVGKAKEAGFRTDLDRWLTGPVRTWRVKGPHRELHDAHNEEFALQLRECMTTLWKSWGSSLYPLADDREVP